MFAAVLTPVRIPHRGSCTRRWTAVPPTGGASCPRHASLRRSRLQTRIRITHRNPWAPGMRRAGRIPLKCEHYLVGKSMPAWKAPTRTGGASYHRERPPKPWTFRPNFPVARRAPRCRARPRCTDSRPTVTEIREISGARLPCKNQELRRCFLLATRKSHIH